MIGMTILAAMLVVWIGIWLLSRVGKRLTQTSPKKGSGSLWTLIGSQGSTEVDYQEAEKWAPKEKVE
eukprot:209456-Karenia_brevis.AAC.1